MKKHKLTSGQQEELNYHTVKFNKRDPKTWVNNNYRRIITEDFGVKPDFFVNKSILDIGGGPGGGLYFSPFLKTKKRVIIDPLVKEFEELLKDFKNISGDVETIVGHAEDMPFSDGSFDLILSFNSLDHWDDWKKGMDEAIRVLKKGGKLLLYVNFYRPAKTDAHPHYIDEKSIDWIISRGLSVEFSKLKLHVKESGKKVKKYFGIFKKL